MTHQDTSHDLPLTDPKHPLHRPAAVAAPKTEPTKAQVAKGKQVKAAIKATAKGKAKPAHKPTAIARTADNPIKSIVPSKFKTAYAAHNDTCGSKLALALKAATTVKNKEGRDSLDVDALFKIARANGIDTKGYVDLNNGQKRMNVGNKLAGRLKAGETVTIGSQKFANAEKALAHQAAA